ncbi:ParA family protein [Moritella viscosa]|uniref:ParA family protein n=1 Tax=Moritella viscosa TaxID=80854 RepID=UPI00091A1964|nr:division plane positioning ATPase MipZ [Moritella viscosa]SGZ17384.1 Plasmid partitioning protein [Moritella viscosa]SHO06520.1 Plasmid partitioning protein [Moritella viscosa]
MIIAIGGTSKGGIGKTITAASIAHLLKAKLLENDIRGQLKCIENFREHSELEKLDVEYPKDKKELIKALKKSTKNNYIVVDCGGYDSELNRVVIAAADLIISPCKNSTLEHSSLIEFHSVIAAVSVKVKRKINVHILRNRIHPSTTNFEDFEYISTEFEHFKLLNTVIRQRVDFEKAIESGASVTELKAYKHNKSTKEIKALVAEIKTLVA